MHTELPRGASPIGLPFSPSPPLQPASGLDGHDGLVPLVAMPCETRRAIVCPKILVFDSGLGGLTVFREVARVRPDAALLYVADDALFPYGRLSEAELIARVVALMGGLIAAHRPDLVVIACNTASTLVLPTLRTRFAVPFIGTVPAIKPACAASVSKCISVLGTDATVKREYTHALIRRYGEGCVVNLIGSAHLAGYAEREFAGDPVDDALLWREIAPAFVEGGSVRTDTVVLACTHYPLLAARLERLAPWPVRWIDPSPAIARRVVELVGAPQGPASTALAEAIFTSGQQPAGALARALRGFGIGNARRAPAAPIVDSAPLSP